MDDFVFVELVLCEIDFGYTCFFDGYRALSVEEKYLTNCLAFRRFMAKYSHRNPMGVGKFHQKEVERDEIIRELPCERQCKKRKSVTSMMSFY